MESPHIHETRTRILIVTKKLFGDGAAQRDCGTGHDEQQRRAVEYPNRVLKTYETLYRRDSACVEATRWSSRCYPVDEPIE